MYSRLTLLPRVDSCIGQRIKLASITVFGLNTAIHSTL